MSDFNLRALSMKMCSAGFGAVGGVFQHDSETVGLRGGHMSRAQGQCHQTCCLCKMRNLWQHPVLTHHG